MPGSAPDAPDAPNGPDEGGTRVTPRVRPSERLRLEPLTVDDADEMEAVLSDAALYRFTGGSPPHVEELRRRYRFQVAGTSPDGREDWHNWVVRLRSDGTAIGFTQATVERASGVAELAWVVGTRWQGNGYGREAVVALVAALRETGCSRLLAHVHPEHAASGRVAEHAGLRRTGRLVDGEEEWEWRPP
jgi:RimJ/RimL family protein N-acetyltransferase